MLLGLVSLDTERISTLVPLEKSCSLRTASTIVVAVASAANARIDRSLSAAIEGRLVLGTPATSQSPIDAVRDARGDFAMLAATADGLLVAASDGGGYRPLYVARIEGGVAACTALEPLLGLLRVRPRLNERFLAQSALLEPACDPSATPYVGIERVPPGQAWLLSEHSVHKVDLVRAVQAVELCGDERALAAATRAELEASLARAVEDRRGFAIAWSGGVDSSALVGLSADLERRGALQAQLRAYHWDFETSAPGDDRPYLRAVESHLSLRSCPVRPLEAAADFWRSFVIDAAPAPFPTIPLFIALARRARNEGDELLLTGVGGDQVLDGQPALLGDLVRRGRPLAAVSRALRLRGPDIGGTGWRLRQWLLRPALGRLVPGAVRRAQRQRAIQRAYNWAGPRLRKHLDDVSAAPERRPSLDWSPRERYQWLRSMPIFDMYNALRSQIEIAVGGILQRDPYLDADFLRFVATLPPLALLAGDYRRGLLREAARGAIPELVRLRETKAPLNAAILEAMGPGGGFSALGGLADAHKMADLGLVEPRPFRRAFDAAARAPLSVPWLALWPILSVEAFLRWYAGEPLGVPS